MVPHAIKMEKEWHGGSKEPNGEFREKVQEKSLHKLFLCALKFGFSQEISIKSLCAYQSPTHCNDMTGHRAISVDSTHENGLMSARTNIIRGSIVLLNIRDNGVNIGMLERGY